MQQRQFQKLLFIYKKTTTINNQKNNNKKQIRFDISRESSAGIIFHTLFFRNLRKMLQNLSSAAVVIGAIVEYD